MKYIIFDLDDTILDKKKNLSKYTLSILEKMRKMGYYIVINTARSKNNSTSIFTMIKPDYAIYSAGALITDKHHNIIYENLISPSILNSILKDLISNKATRHISIETINCLYADDPNYVQATKNTKYFSPTNVFSFPATKIIVDGDSKTFFTELGIRYKLNYVSYLNGTWGRFSKGTKETGNQKLYEILNDKEPISYVFGDDLGDIEMIQNATFGVLMKNAHPSFHSLVKEISEYSNEEDGVARYLEKIHTKKESQN